MEIQEIMTTDVTTAHPDQLVGELHDLFTRVCYHHIPVVSDDKLLGIVSDRDVSRSLSLIASFDEEQPSGEALLQQSAEDIMTRAVVTVDRTTSIDCASILLLENNISCLPIIDDDNSLEGILTWKDILRFHVYYDAT